MGIKYLLWILKVRANQASEQSDNQGCTRLGCVSEALTSPSGSSENQPGNNREASAVPSSLIYRVLQSCPRNGLRFNISSSQKEIEARWAGGSVCVIRSRLQRGFFTRGEEAGCSPPDHVPCVCESAAGAPTR